MLIYTMGCSTATPNMTILLPTSRTYLHLEGNAMLDDVIYSIIKEKAYYTVDM